MDTAMVRKREMTVMDMATRKKSTATVTSMERKDMDMITARRVTVMVPMVKLTVTTTNIAEITITDLRGTNMSMTTSSA
jgi:hypothetical protein